MIDYLKQFNITSENIEELKTVLPSEAIENLEVMQHNVSEVLTFLTEFGVKNIMNILKYRLDICFRSKETIEQDFTVLDKDMLIFIIDNDIDDLINFNI